MTSGKVTLATSQDKMASFKDKMTACQHKMADCQDEVERSMSAGQEVLNRDTNSGHERFQSEISSMKSGRTEFEGKIADTLHG
jgi:hypothetical protein